MVNQTKVVGTCSAQGHVLATAPKGCPARHRAMTSLNGNDNS
ncbi:hypothetical protein [Streptomyces sp. NPDC002521]